MEEGAKTGHHALYPLFLDLQDQTVLVVGAGSVAARKIETLLRYGARVRVVAPEASDPVRVFAESDMVEYLPRAFEPSDVTGALFVIAATNDQDVNTAVFEATQAQNTLVNVVDVPELCTAVVPSVMKRGLLQIAVSTSGAAPSLARRLRQGLEEDFPVWWETYLEVLSEARTLVKQRVEGAASVRTPLFEALSDGRLQGRIAAGEHVDAEQAYSDYVEPLLGGQRASSAEGRAGVRASSAEGRAGVRASSGVGQEGERA